MRYLVDLTAREAEVIRVLNALSPHLIKFVVVGGYAVNALASHRFSVDCDLVIDEKDLPFFGKTLKGEGYARRKRTRLFKGIYGARVGEYIKLVGGRRVSVDLFINSMICRQTGGRWSYRLIRKNSFESNVIGLTDASISSVPRRELLMAMKMHSARDADLRDVIMLSEGADWNEVARFMRCGDKAKVIKQLTRAIETIGGTGFASALRAQFGLRSDATSLIRRAAEGLNKVKKLLS